MFQNATQNSLEMVEDPKAAAVDEIAAKLGLCKVGPLFLPVLFDSDCASHIPQTQRLSAFKAEYRKFALKRVTNVEISASPSRQFYL